MIVPQATRWQHKHRGCYPITRAAPLRSEIRHRPAVLGVPGAWCGTPQVVYPLCTTNECASTSSTTHPCPPRCLDSFEANSRHILSTNTSISIPRRYEFLITTTIPLSCLKQQTIPCSQTSSPLPKVSGCLTRFTVGYSHRDLFLKNF